MNDNIVVVDGILLEITERCNASCSYCYNSSGASRDVPIDTVFEVLMDIYSVFGRINTLKISGGEPSMHPKWLKLCTFLDDHPELCNEVEIITNGSAFDCTDTRWLFKQTIQLTLESPKEEIHDSIRGEGNFVKIGKILDSRIPSALNGRLILRVNLSRRNCYNLEDFINYSISRNVDEIVFSFLKYSGRAKEDSEIINCVFTPTLSKEIIDEIDKLKHKNSGVIRIRNDCKPKSICGITDFNMPHIAPVISSHGTVYLCEGISNSMALGSVYDNSISELLRSKVCEGYINIIKDRKEKICRSSNCIWQYICPKGCAGEAVDYYNDVYHKVDECWYYREWFKSKLGI